MKGIRKYGYSALLMLSALNLDPTVASAQDEGGRFSLPHGVHWKDAIVPAGDYRFTVEAVGPSELLKLLKVSGAPASFMLMVNDTDVTPTSEGAKLVSKSEGDFSYVSLMSLPQFDLSLHFAAPRKETTVAEMRTVVAIEPVHR
jgi:hypothetical protein